MQSIKKADVASGRVTYFKMDKCLLTIWLLRTESLENDRICTFAEYLYLTIGTADDSRHPFPCRVELAHVEDLIFVRCASDVDKDRFGLAGLQEPENVK